MAPDEYEAKLVALRETLQASIADTERFSADEVEWHVEAELDAWEASVPIENRR